MNMMMRSPHRGRMALVAALLLVLGIVVGLAA
jgi:hypothetical protein